MPVDRTIIGVFWLGLCFATSAAADNYDFELSFAFDKGDADSTSISTLNGVPMPSLGMATSSSDSDDFSLNGVWFYSGLSDAEGPRSRAAFVSRASGVALGFSRSDVTSSFEFVPGPPLLPASGTTDETTDALSVDLRHVWRDSGWYALAEIARAEFEVTTFFNGTPTSSGTIDSNNYAIGVGKYLGKTTAVDLSIASVEVGDSSAAAVALSLSHIGSVGQNWQYGTDVVYAKSDTSGDGDAFIVRGALYPSTDIEFGLSFARQELLGGSDLDVFEVFGGWFVREHIEISARYRHDEPPSFPGTDSDSNEFGVGVSFRF